MQGKRNVRFLFVLWYAPKHSLNTANISAVIFHIRAVLLQFFHYPEKEFSVSSARFSFFSLVFPHLFFFLNCLLNEMKTFALSWTKRPFSPRLPKPRPCCYGNPQSNWQRLCVPVVDCYLTAVCVCVCVMVFLCSSFVFS